MKGGGYDIWSNNLSSTMNSKEEARRSTASPKGGTGQAVKTPVLAVSEPNTFFLSSVVRRP